MTREIENKLTALVCIYNGTSAKLFDMALDSILRQSLLPAFVCVAQDGFLSTDHISIVKKFTKLFTELDVSVTQITSSVNIGHGKIRNMALGKINTDYVAICDSDDISHPNRFQNLVSIIKADQNIAVVGSNIIETNLLVSNSPCYHKKVPITFDNIKESIGIRCPVNQMSCLFRLNYVLNVGGYVDFYHNEDYFLWLRLLNANFKIVNTEQTLVTAHSDLNSVYRRGALNTLSVSQKYSCFYTNINIKD